MKKMTQKNINNFDGKPPAFNLSSQKLKIQTIPFRLFLLKNALKETQWTLSVQKAHAAVNRRNYDRTMDHRH